MSKQSSLLSFLKGKGNRECSKASSGGDDVGGDAHASGSGITANVSNESGAGCSLRNDIEDSLSSANEHEPPDKQIKTNDGKSKTVRSFCEKWKLERPWLIYNVETKLMFCKTCEKLSRKRNGAFVVGCSTMKIETILAHEESSDHQNNCKIAIAKSVGVEKSKAGKTLQQLNSAQRGKLDKIFRNAHFIAKEAKSLNDFVRLATLDKAKGVDTGDSYINRTECREFLSCLADVERQQIQQQFQ